MRERDDGMGSRIVITLVEKGVGWQDEVGYRRLVVRLRQYRHMVKVVTSIPFAILRQRKPLVLFIRLTSILKSEKDVFCHFLLAH